MSNAAEEEKIKKKVRETFEEFIENFSSDAVEAALSSGAESVGHDYLDQCRQMANNERSTLYVDFRHVQQHQSDLADAIQAEYYHFEPTLRDALREVMRREHAEYATDDKDFVVNFFNMPVQQCIRDLRTDKIAKLISFQGTVTRTSEVRPELLVAVFQCELCGARSDPVEQQFKYSEPVKCKNASCPNQKEWKLLSSTEGTKFVDWQRVRVQENVAEIPAGSMPRTMDVILRGENVERAKAGDKCVFCGSLIVVPAVGQLAAPGERVEVVQKIDTRNPTEGVTGLNALGTRDLTYKLAFLAASVQPAEARFGYVSIRDDSDEAILESFTAQVRLPPLLSTARPSAARPRRHASPRLPASPSPPPPAPSSLAGEGRDHADEVDARHLPAPRLVDRPHRLRPRRDQEGAAAHVRTAQFGAQSGAQFGAQFGANA